MLRNVTLTDGREEDVFIRDGVIAAIGKPGGAGPSHADRSTHASRHAGEPEPPAVELDLTGYLLLPAPVEPHAHLDKAYSADQVPNPDGDLMGAVRGWLAHRTTMSQRDITARAEAAIRAYVANGVTQIRTHVDIGPGIELRGLEAVLAVKAPIRPQIVAFGSNPLSGSDGARNRDLLREAVAMGADVVGACPALDPDPKACIEFCLQLAADARLPLDLHVDEMLDPDPCTLALLADAVLATGFEHGVVASHCVSLGMMPPAQAREIALRVAKAGIAVVCLPQTNLYLQGRMHEAAPPRGLTAMRLLREAGAVVAGGGDNLQDPFNIMGRADALETAALLVMAGHDSPQQAYDAVSTCARRALGLRENPIGVGAAADLLAIRAGSLREAIATAHPDRVVVRAGRVAALTTLTTDWPT
ncbi:amidohydrolase family protein [Allorhizocola rhizosphaerae]|uniref:amidohydrolase family protein n=1 Tax=Allorhizocola rhizosphaerae TaxID=1872709 RepID=UPI0013C36398|nr:amidohydrolase family protein [Allorhizocola rhizosphaerae]